MMAGMRVFLVAGRFGPDELLIRSAFWSSEPNLCIGADLCRRKPRALTRIGVAELTTPLGCEASAPSPRRTPPKALVLVRATHTKCLRVRTFLAAAERN